MHAGSRLSATARPVSVTKLGRQDTVGPHDMIDSCHTHRDEPPAGTCRSCLRAFCDHCLVYAFGHHKPPYCIRCALVATGVRAPDPETAPARD